MPFPNEEGALNFKVEVRRHGLHDDLIITFEEPVNWIGFHKADAEKLVGILQEKIKEMADPINPRFNPN